MKLIFTPDEGGDILNATIRDSDTTSVVYTVETLKHAAGTLTTTVTRRNQIDESITFVFRILWKCTKGSSKDVKVVLDFWSLEEVPVGEILENAPGSTT